MDPIIHVIRAGKKLHSILASPLSAFTFVAAHVFVFPIDCFFLAYDIVAVNLRKFGLFGGDCRNIQGRCGAPLKYTNRWMFRLFVCPRAVFKKHSSQYSCGTPDRGPHPVRGLLGLCFLAALLAAGIGAFVVTTYEERPGRPNGRSDRELIADYSRRADAAFSRKDYREALEYYEKLLRLVPRHRQGLYRAGICMEKGGDLKRAQIHYARAMSGKDGIADAGARLAALLYAEGSVRRARACARDALQMGSDAATVHALVAEDAAMRGKTKEATRHLDKAVAQNPDHPIVMSARARTLLKTGRIEEAARLMAQRREPISLPTWRLCEAELLWKQGHPTKASRKLEEYLFDHPKSHHLRVTNVRILLATGKVDEALGRIRRMRNELALPYPYIMQLALALKKYDRSDPALDIALDLTRQEQVRIPAHLLAAEIYLENDLTVRAAHHSNAILSAEPDNLKALLLAGRTRLRQGESDKARESLQKALKASPDSAEVHYRLGRLKLLSGENASARAKLETACRLAPDNGEYRLFHGRALMAAGQYGEAAKAFQAAASHLSDPYSAYTHLGWLAREQGNQDQALAWYQKAIKANPSRAAVAYHNLAEILLQDRHYVPLALAMSHTALALSSPQERVEMAGVLADALTRSGYPRMAVRPARLAAQLTPDQGLRQLTLGITEAAAGNTHEAITALEKALKLTDKEQARKHIRGIIDSLTDDSSATDHTGANEDG